MSHQNILLEYVRLWGGAASEAVLDPLCKTFTTAGVEGFIAYRDQPECAVAIGDPVCAAHHVSELATAFHDYCKNNQKSVVYILVSKEYEQFLMQNFCKVSLEFGQEIILNPASENLLKGARGKVLRQKINHAKQSQVTVNEYLEEDQSLEEQMVQVGRQWLKNRHGPQVHISQIELFSNRSGKRWFYAKHDQKIVGVLMLNQLQAKQGWLFDRVMATQEAPNGTNELLIATAIEHVQKDGCNYISLGLVPGDRLGDIKGLSKITGWLIRQLYSLIKLILPIKKLKRFWKKFHPKEEPAFILFSKPSISFLEIRSLFRALNVSIKKT